MERRHGRPVSGPQPRPNRARRLATWGVSVVNGYVGDYLRARDNGLAIEMAFYHDGRPLTLTPAALRRAHPDATPKLCVLVHGLACSERTWLFPDPDAPDRDTTYGALLRRDLGYTPFYLRYNTGLPIADNGQSLAALLDRLVASYPTDVDDIALIGHSMGGLVLRSACHYGALDGAAWVEKVRQVFYLGTPHEGAPLVKIGHAVMDALHTVPDPITRLIGDVINVTSQGIKDLREGAFVDAGDLEEVARGHPVPWLPHASHHMIVASLGSDPSHPASVILGDGLVSISAAHAKSAHAGEPPANHHIRFMPQMSHLRLTCDMEVYMQIRDWCAAAPSTPKMSP
ncbi:MAG: alpha/beta hydrolase [Anaerolineae bacterium]